jgi:ABC-type nickel/cobalt efflux system permease component RcnA
MFGILGLGFLLGMQHALEADHIAAVSSIAVRRTHVGDIVKHGLTWGLGHTLTLFAFAGAAILLGHAIPEHLARPIEAAVGIMLIGLGAHVLWRLWRDRMHFHKHGHGGGTPTRTAMPVKPLRMPGPPTPMRTAFAGARCWSD